MTFSRIVILGTVVWVAAISLLHGWLNLGVFDPAPADRQLREKFRVGFLPVT